LQSARLVATVTELGVVRRHDAMKAITAISCAAFAGSAMLQAYLAIWHPSSFGRFAEFPAILLYTVIIVAAAFLVLVMPSFLWLRRKGRRVSWFVGALCGALLGCLIGFVMFLDSIPAHLPMNLAEICAAGISGAVAVSLYARLSFKPVA
jgi:hypothetical protein